MNKKRHVLVRLREADLHEILQSPEGTRLLGMYYNYERATFDIVLEGDALPESDYGAIPPEAPAIIEKHYADLDGKMFLSGAYIRIEWPLREDHMLPEGVQSTQNAQ